ncbi:MAG: hypothetical protein ACHQM6_09145, partial [Candidatus Kapaibacterium sp.]
DNLGGGIFSLPSSGGGLIMTSSGGVSPVWLLGGNNNPFSTLIGTITANDFSVITQNITRATFSNTPSSSTPMLLLQNTTPGIQGVHIYGSTDATTSSTLAGNPGVWDLVVEGDAIVTGILKTGGGSLWIDGNSPTHALKSDAPLNITTSTNDSILFGTNGTTKMTIGANGFVGIGTMNPQSPLHIMGTPPNPTVKDVTGYFYTPDPFNHVLTVENMAANGKGNGIAIVIHNPANSDKYIDGQYNNEASNYLTFYNDNGDHTHIRGRVEGYSYQNLNDMIASIASILSNTDLYNPFNYFTCNLGFNTGFLDNCFDPNFITFPTLSGGSWPSFTYYDLSFSLPSASVSIPYPCLSGACGCIPDICYYTTTIGGGSFDFGSFPDGLTGGSWPTLSGFSISNPLTLQNIQSPITNLTNPFSVNYSFINGILDQIKAVPYKQKIIDIVSSGPQAAIIKAAATYAMAFFAGGVTYESGSGDYAEWLERADHNENVGIGDVVGVAGGKISKNTIGANQFMVASWKPCVLGNMPDEGKEQFFNKVAFMGQVPVKLFGSVKKGDYIIPSGRNDGFATAISPENMTVADLDKVLGVSWQDAPDAGVKMVKIAVGLKPHEMVKIIQDEALEIENLKPQINEIDDLLSEAAQIKSSMNLVHHAKYSKKRSKHAKLISSN